jgi:hypothetical protein
VAGGALAVALAGDGDEALALALQALGRRDEVRPFTAPASSVAAGGKRENDDGS